MLSENLALLQAERGETNYRLAKSIGVHQTSVANWKNGVCIPHPKYQALLAEHYDVTVNELMEGVIQPDEEAQ